MHRLRHLLSVLALLAIVPRAAASVPPRSKPKTAEATQAYDQAYAELQKKAYATALPLYEKALAMAPARAEIWNEYAICLRGLRRFPAAVRAGWRAIQLDAGHTMQPWNAQANTFMETREWQAATACLEQVARLHKDGPFLAHAWLNLAFRKLAAGEAEGVVDLCRRACRLAPEESLAWIDLGQALACAGADPKEAAAPLEKGLALAQTRKDAARVAYAQQLLDKVKAKASVWPPRAAGQSWQVLPSTLRERPEGDASQVPLPALVEHRFTLVEGGSLGLSVPEPWAEAFDPPRSENQFTVRFTPPGSTPFKVYLSPLRKPHPEGLQATAERLAKLLLSGSVEKTLVPQDLGSATVKGCWLLSTNRSFQDKAPAQGEYRHLVSVFADLDGLECVGTILTNDPSPARLDTCLQVFRTLQKTGPTLTR